MNFKKVNYTLGIILTIIMIITGIMTIIGSDKQSFIHNENWFSDNNSISLNVNKSTK
jgi:hypothetical protein